MPQETALTAPRRTIAIAPNTDLGSALLIAESDSGSYEPITGVGSINEAITMANENFTGRRQKAERGGDCMCPARYIVWARDFDGVYQNVHVIELS